MSFGFGFFKPLVKVVLSAVVGSVFKAENLFGSGNGHVKAPYALTDVTNQLLAAPSIDSSRVPEAAEAIKGLIDAIVGVLNAIGALDDQPGLKLDLDAILPAGKAAYNAVLGVVDAFESPSQP
jgi:hypothetical protein